MALTALLGAWGGAVLITQGREARALAAQVKALETDLLNHREADTYMFNSHAASIDANAESLRDARANITALGNSLSELDARERQHWITANGWAR